MKYSIAFDLDFKRNPYKGTYIVLEGIDGSGKTKQVEAIAEYFQQHKKTVVLTHEPRKTGSIFGNLVHRMLLGEIKVSSLTLQYIFTADRVENHNETVIPALKAGNVVISHRSFWSIVPYAISDLDPKIYTDLAQFQLVANSVLSMYHQFIIPNYTFYLHVPIAVAVKRLAGRKDKKREFYEQEKKVKKNVV